MWLIQAAAERMQIIGQVTGEEIKQGWGGLIFTGCFILVCIIVFIVWLSRR